MQTENVGTWKLCLNVVSQIYVFSTLFFANLRTSLVFIYCRYKFTVTKLMTLQIPHCTKTRDCCSLVKVNLSLCFKLVPPHEGVLREWRYISTHSLTSALEGGQWSASRPGRFTPRERAPDTPWIGGWVCLRVVLDAVVKRKIPSLAGNRTPIFSYLGFVKY
jgi:hypothetical protein